jgi:AcrR family transcriptional regulator
VAQKRISVQDRRRALVEAAVRVMAREGIAAATTRAICAEAGMENGFFHYCFNSKEELMSEVIDVFESHWQALAEQVSQIRGTLRDVLSAGFAAYLDDVFTQPGMHRLNYELTVFLLHEAESADITRHQYLGYPDIAETFLSGAAAVAHSTWTVPVRTLSEHVAVVIDGVTLEWLSVRDDERARRHFELLTDFLTGFARPDDAEQGSSEEPS